jgi:peptidoglycan/LPS O-acetylase OafA/YrhL
MAGTWGVALWERLGVVARWSALGAAVVIFGLIPQLWAFRSTYPIYADERNWLMLELPCCFIILVYVIAGSGCRETAWLRSRTTRFIGRISFSLYLFHAPIVDIIHTLYSDHTDWRFFRQWPVPMELLLLAVVMTVSLPASLAVFEWVELPFTRLGRVVAGWINGEQKVGTPAPPLRCRS